MNTLEQMIERGHERVCFHQDPATGLRAIVAIHNTKLGNALGGTRRWHYATESEALYDVLRLSEGMTYKAACAGLQMGGAKSVVLLSRPSQAATEAEARAMGRFVDTFGGTYIAAEDVGVNTQFVDWMAMETRHVMGGETVSTGGDPSPYTAAGVINAMKACLVELDMPRSFEGLTVALQGLGNVGSKVAKTLIEQGATIFATEINPINKQRAQKELGIKLLDNDQSLFTMECDILAPCALGGVIDGNLASKLRCRILCGGANNVLDDPDEDAVLLKKAGVLYAPDFVANAGGLIRLAGLYLGMTERQLDQKIADIETTTLQIFEQARKAGTSTHAAAVSLALQRIASGSASAQEKVHAR